MNSTFKPALLLMTGRVVAFAATFFIPVVLVRIFDQAEFGTYKQVFLIYGTLFGIAQFGLAESLFYFLPSEPGKAGRFIFNSMLGLLASGIAFFLLLVWADASISGWLKNGRLPDYLGFLGMYLVLMLASTVLEIAMISRKQYLWASFSYGLSDLMRAAMFILPALVLQDVKWLLLGGVAYAAARFLTAAIYLKHEFGSELRPDAAMLRKQMAYALPFQMAVVVEIIQANFHHYAVSYSFDAATFAIYSVGCLQIPLVDFVAGPAANVMMVRMAEERRDNRRDVVLAIWHDTARKLALIFFPAVALLLVTSRELIVFLFTDNYVASVPVFRIWTLTILFAVLQTDSVMRVFAQTRFLLVLHLTRLLVIASLIGWFLGVFHLPGAVAVTLIASLVSKSAALVRLRKLLGVEFRRLLPWNALGAIAGVAALAAFPAALVKAHIATPLFPLLLTTGMVFGTAYVLFLFNFGLLSEGERLAVTGLLRRPAPPVPKGVAKSVMQG